MSIFQKILWFIVTLLLALLIYFSVTLIEKGEISKNYKSDYAILYSSEFGMFNGDLWKQKIMSAVDKKIENFSLNTNNREEVKGYIKTIIETLVIEAERVVKERNKGRGFLDSLLGSTKQMITDSIIDFKDLRKRVPEFTDRVMTEMEKPENQARAKTVIQEKLKEFMKEQSLIHTDMSLYNAVLSNYKTTDPKICADLLNQKREALTKQMDILMMMMLATTLFIVLFILFSGTLQSFTLLILSATTITMLVAGIMLPMLDIEAKIHTLSFTLLDQTIVFENQILFFQSKSIYDLVNLLIHSDQTKMIFVGILLVMFSIIFPTLKLIATAMYYYSQSMIGNNPVTRFFALYSTKWSMADVFVVSIFMAYLGLDGVVSSELRHLEGNSMPINIITTNGTHLEVGFFLFIGFVFTSFSFAYMVGKRKKAN